MKKLLAALSLVLLMAGTCYADDVKDVEQAVEQMRQALLGGKRADLEKIPLPDLIYVHSAGNAETAKEFVDAIADGMKDTYKRVEFNHQVISTNGAIAIVRHVFDGTLVSKGVNNEQPYDVHLGVVQIWKKDGGAWKLQARQSFRLSF